MLEQVVNFFHVMSETNPVFFVDNNDFLDVWNIDHKEALMLYFSVTFYIKQRSSKAYYTVSAGMGRQLLPSGP